jgi:hypothetical protein
MYEGSMDTDPENDVGTAPDLGSIGDSDAEFARVLNGYFQDLITLGNEATEKKYATWAHSVPSSEEQVETRTDPLGDIKRTDRDEPPG